MPETTRDASETVEPVVTSARSWMPNRASPLTCSLLGVPPESRHGRNLLVIDKVRILLTGCGSLKPYGTRTSNVVNRSILHKPEHRSSRHYQGDPNQSYTREALLRMIGSVWEPDGLQHKLNVWFPCHLGHDSIRTEPILQPSIRRCTLEAERLSRGAACAKHVREERL